MGAAAKAKATRKECQMKTLKSNYQKNIEVMRINLERGLDPSFAIQSIRNWRKQFIDHNLYGDEERAFINDLLKEVERYTHIHVEEVSL